MSHPQKGDILSVPHKNKTLIDFLSRRRSNLAKVMSGPGPSADELETMLTIASRVPDHRKLSPWRYIIFQGDSRQEFGKIIGESFKNQNPDLPEERTAFEADRLMRAPLVIAVISSPVDCPRGTPKWEQELSAGAVCFNLCLAAQSFGYGAQWLTEWYAYDDSVTNALEIDDSERVAGFIYVGTVSEAPNERDRPVIHNKITHWSE